MNNSVVVYLDGTPEFEEPINHAIRLVSHPAGEIVLAATSKGFTQAEDYLEHIAAVLRNKAVVIQHHISICTASSNDDVVTAIQAAVDLFKARAVIVSDKLATCSKIHLLKTAYVPVIRIHSMKRAAPLGHCTFTKPILVPLDNSEFAELALLYAMNMARSANVPVILLTVVPSLRDTFYINAVAAGQPSSFLAEQVLQEQETLIGQEARQYLVNLRNELERGDCGKVLTRIEYGNEVHSIVSCAQLYNVEAIIMASRHHSILGHFMALSVPDQVIRWTERPVLTISAPSAEPVVSSNTSDELSRSIK